LVTKITTPPTGKAKARSPTRRQTKDSVTSKMEPLYPQNWPQFYTATIEGWKHLLKDDKYKSAIIDSLKYLKSQGRIKINAFVIMDNHIHLIWQLSPWLVTNITTPSPCEGPVSDPPTNK
jgi:hypothetical protein